MISRLCIHVAVFLFVCVFAAQAQTDEFNVRMRIVGDANPPTTPTGLSATPVASSQIDLSWNAATDDTVLGGYQVFRDAIQIATTSLTTYADTGLTADTLYSYFVTAFDTSENFSSSSAAVSTTTLDIPAPVSDDGGGGSDLYLIHFDVIPDIRTVQVEWQTRGYAQFELRWGRTAAYELGFVSNELFKHTHSTVITDLEPGTTYSYQLLGFDRDGRRHALSSGEFKTLEAPDITPPSNVSGLRAALSGNDVELSWENPSDPDFAFVRIVRSHLFYPDDPYDGFIAYQGDAEVFSDSRALSKYDAQYYTVFAYDTQGNISSGAVVAAAQQAIATSGDTEHYPAFPLSFSDIEVIQNGAQVQGGTLDANAPFLLRIAYEKLPEHLKTVRVTFTHPVDQNLTFSFLLRINKDKTDYEAHIAPLRTAGVYPVVVTVFDHKTQKMQQVEGSYRFLAGAPLSPTGLSGSTERIFYTTGPFFWAIALGLLLLLVYVIVRKKMTRHTAVAALKVLCIVLFCTGLLCASFVFIESSTTGAAVISGLPLFFVHPFFLACIALCCVVFILAVLAKRK